MMYNFGKNKNSRVMKLSMEHPMNMEAICEQKITKILVVSFKKESVTLKKMYNLPGNR